MQYINGTKFIKERDKVIKSQDVEKLKAFCKEWQARGVYANMKLPSDEVLAISLRKMMLSISSATEEEKAEARKWLTDRGYRAEPL